MAAGDSRSTRREQLLERCQRQRNDLIAMTATAVALAPHLRQWARLARSIHGVLRVLQRRSS